MLSKPSTLARSLTDYLKTNANSALEDIAAAIPTEFNLAKLLNELKNQANICGVNLMIPQTEQLLTCMSAICGTDITTRAQQLQNFIDKYSFNGTGEIDVAELLETQGLGKSAIQSVNSVINRVDTVMSDIDSAVSSGASRLKSLFPDSDDCS